MKTLGFLTLAALSGVGILCGCQTAGEKVAQCPKEENAMLSGEAENARIGNAVPAPFVERRSQKLTVEFRDATAAEAATLTTLPLYNGYEWAISSRWDDNNPEDVKMRDVLAKHGYRGTFYLNSREQVDISNWNTWEASLFEGGNTIGGHSFSHPFLTYCSRNEIFNQIARIRVEREASSNRGINSYAFSFCDFANPVEGDVIRTDIAEALFRSGYYHVAEHPFIADMESNMLVSYLLPADGMAPIDGEFAKFLADPLIKEKNPCISFDMHVWYKTPEAWAQFESELDKYGRNPKWWYCNQSEYAAYRLQFLNTQLAVARKGNRLDVTLDRPCLRDLNYAIPLTFEVQGISPEDVLAISAPGARVERADQEGKLRFHLHHPEDQQLPTKIDWIRNDRNYATLQPSAEFPGLFGTLRQESSNRIVLQLESATDAQPVEDVVATFRLPLQFNDALARWDLDDLAPGGSQCVTKSFMWQAGNDGIGNRGIVEDAKYTSGAPFFVAQVDFLYGGAPSRLYLTCDGATTPADASYPAEGFTRLGPVPHDKFTMEWANEVVKQPAAVPPLNGVGELVWQPAQGAVPGRYDAEVVHTTGLWVFMVPEPRGYYLLRSAVDSPTEQDVEWRHTPDRIKAIYLNGTQLEGGRGRLNPGANDLCIVYSTVEATFDPNNFNTIFNSLHPSNAGFFLRAVSPETSERITELRYLRPKTASSGPVPGLGM